MLRILACLTFLGITSTAGAVPLVSQVELTDLNGNSVSLAGVAADKEIKVVTFLGTECPLAKLYAGRLQALAKEFPSAAFVGVNSNRQDTLEEISAFARRHATSFPMFKDLTADLADELEAKRTPEVFVLDANWQVVYRGRIDDQYGVGYARDSANREDLRIALQELAAGKPVSVPRTDAVGCVIGRARMKNEQSKVTYANQVSRILQKHCLECHRTGEIAPFALEQYDEVAGWSETIEEVIRDRRMPPWHANPAHGDFKNQRLMTDEEKQLIYDWVKNGAPEGDPADLPVPREYVSGWQLPHAPDQVVDMRNREFAIPSDGVVEYQYFVVDPGFTEEKWIRGAEVIPGNREVVHHCIVFVRPPESSDIRGFGWVAAYVPGQMPLVMPEGYARRIPAGSKFVFQMHYTPNGSPQLDKTKVGMIFAKPDLVTREVITLAALNRRFEIPPNESEYRVETSIDWLPESGEVVAMAPHMHFRGKSFRYIAESDSGDDVLLDVPAYDFNWQHIYQPTIPRRIDDVQRVRCVATFDNSDGNLSNPDPSAFVTWGDQTFEEMMVGFMDIAVDRDAKIQLPWEEEETADPERDRAEVKKFIERFDADGDGKVVKKEVATSFAIFAFRRLDKNNDGEITFEEALAAR